MSKLRDSIQKCSDVPVKVCNSKYNCDCDNCAIDRVLIAISKHMAECPRLTDVEQITIIENLKRSWKDMIIIGAKAQYKLCEEHLLKEDE